MFANQRQSTAGLGSIGAVAVVLVAWVFATGVFLKVYREGRPAAFVECGR
jgi:hypothetical protein